MKNLSARNENLDIPRMDDLKAENQILNYTVATTLAKLVIGETLGTAFGKLAKAVDELIIHLADSTMHITAAERTSWNSKAEGNHTHSNMTAATASAAGKAGLVPAPAAGKQTSFLRGDGTWVIPTNTTYSAATTTAAGLMSAADKAKLDGVAAGANNYTYTLPAAASTTMGGVKIGYTANGKNYPVQLSNEQMYVNVPWTDTNTTYSNMTAATASAAGKAGLVPAPAAGKQTSFLRGDGTWVIPTNTTYSAATTTAAGLMSDADKTKLDGIAASANNYTHPAYTARTGVPAANAAPAFGGTFTVSQPVSDSTGHITAVNSRTITIPSTAATTTAAGLMSAADKAKLDGIETKATANTASTITPKAAGTAALGTDTGFARGDHVHPLQTTIYSTATAPTAATSYYIPAHTGNTSANKSLVNFNGLYTSQLNGTADAAGYSLLNLGNSTAAGTANNKYGILRIYGTNAYYTNLKAFDTTSAATRYIVGTSSAAAVGSATQPVYVSSTGLITKCTYTLGASVPADAKFTDTTYAAATTAANGLMSAADKTKLDSGYLVKFDSGGLYVEY